MAFGFWGLGFRVQGFRVLGRFSGVFGSFWGFRIQGLREGLCFLVSVSGFYGLRLRADGLVV